MGHLHRCETPRPLSDRHGPSIPLTAPHAASHSRARAAPWKQHTPALPSASPGRAPCCVILSSRGFLPRRHVRHLPEQALRALHRGPSQYAAHRAHLSRPFARGSDLIVEITTTPVTTPIAFPIATAVTTPSTTAVAAPMTPHPCECCCRPLPQRTAGLRPRMPSSDCAQILGSRTMPVTASRGAVAAMSSISIASRAGSRRALCVRYATASGSLPRLKR